MSRLCGENREAVVNYFDKNMHKHLLSILHIRTPARSSLYISNNKCFWPNFIWKLLYWSCSAISVMLLLHLIAATKKVNHQGCLQSSRPWNRIALGSNLGSRINVLRRRLGPDNVPAGFLKGEGSETPSSLHSQDFNISRAQEGGIFSPPPPLGRLVQPGILVPMGLPLLMGNRRLIECVPRLHQHPAWSGKRLSPQAI